MIIYAICHLRHNNEDDKTRQILNIVTTFGIFLFVFSFKIESEI